MQDFGRDLSLAVAQVLDQERRTRAWSLELLATTAGLHRTSVGLAVRGARGLTIGSAAVLAAALDLRLSDVVRRAEETLKSI